MKKLTRILLLVLSFIGLSSCNETIDEPSYDIVGYWKFSGFEGKDYPDDYHYMQVTNDMIVVYDRRENEIQTFGYKRTNNTLALTAPFAGEYTSVHVFSASYDVQANLGQMRWDCGKDQKYYFGIWDIWDRD